MFGCRPPLISAAGRPPVPAVPLAGLGDGLGASTALGLGRPADDTLLFGRIFDGSLPSPSQYSGDWREAVLALDLPDVSLHALRHTHASMLIDAGVDIV